MSDTCTTERQRVPEPSTRTSCGSGPANAKKPTCWLKTTPTQRTHCVGSPFGACCGAWALSQLRWLLLRSFTLSPYQSTTQLSYTKVLMSILWNRITPLVQLHRMAEPKVSGEALAVSTTG